MATSLAASLAIAQQIIIRYIDTGVFILGTVGSLINIILFSRSNLRSNSCCTYFLASSIAALVLLSIGIIPLVYAQFNSPNPFFSVNAFCKIRIYVNQWSAMSCRWLLVMACVDRCFACSANPNVHYLFISNIPRRIAILITMACMILPIHALIFANIIPPGNLGCIMSINSVAIYHGFYTIIMGGTLPPLVMFGCTLFIWKSLKKKTQRRALIMKNRTDRRKDIRDHQVLILLLGQVAIFIISTIPFMSNNLYTTFTRDITNKSIDRRAIEGFAQVITELFVYIFPASSFYSNTLVSRKFRSDLLSTFQYFTKYFRRQGTRVSPSNQNRTNATTTNAIPLTTNIKFQTTSLHYPNTITNA